MNKFTSNIIAVILSLGLLGSGNFAYILIHSECITEETTHHKCEMECCQEDDCCEEETPAETKEQIKTDDVCCEVHVEKSMEQDNSILPASNAPEKQKLEEFKSNFAVTDLNSEYCLLVIHKFKTTNIFLDVSNLRI